MSWATLLVVLGALDGGVAAVAPADAGAQEPARSMVTVQVGQRTFGGVLDDLGWAAPRRTGSSNRVAPRRAIGDRLPAAHPNLSLGRGRTH